MKHEEPFTLSVFNSLPAHIAVIDPQGKIVAVNKAWAEFACAEGNPSPLKVSIGADYLDVCRLASDLPDAQSALDGIRSVLEQRCPAFFMEYPCHSPTSRRWFLMQVVPLDRPEQGAVIAHIDITGGKLAEAELREANHRKDEFLAMLAHELRNPLAPIRNAVEVLRRVQSQDPKVVWASHLIGRQVAHISRLVDDLLDISRFTRGRIELHKEILAVGAVVEQVLDINRPLMAERRLSLWTHIPTDPITVEFDRTRLVQVVDNLLGNAIKFSREGGRIELTLEATEAEAILRVRDSGIGIAPEFLPRVFEPFTQADQSLARSGGGLGIGLALVKQLVEMHGGRVGAASAGLGRGAEFTVVLPRFGGLDHAHAGVQEGKCECREDRQGKVVSDAGGEGLVQHGIEGGQETGQNEQAEGRRSGDDQQLQGFGG